MERHFERELQALKESLLKMAALVESSIANAIRALVDRDDDLARRTIGEEEDRIDALDNQIDEQCLRLLALRQPMAVDLRFITAAMKINSDLERIADQSVNIAQRALELNRHPLLKPLIDIPRMATTVQRMVKEGIDAFLNRDTALALAVRQRDREVDDLNQQVFRELLTYMMGDAATIPRAIQLILVTRHLERIGDHAANIAEDVVYLVQGTTIRHRALEGKV